MFVEDERTQAGAYIKDVNFPVGLGQERNLLASFKEQPIWVHDGET